MAELEEPQTNEAGSDAKSEEGMDAFSDNNYRVIQFTTLARIYDVLVALLKETNPDTAREILEVHYNGGLLAPSPSFAGTFLTDEQNTPAP